ncbi:MAG: serine/threonine protein kinase, partial [Myxococcales bacterium]|nr:serine/threonine protein kinase [Myxococcales bacterium]
DGAAESQLQREAQALARVRGDHVVRVYAAGFFMNQPWIAMQLVDGPHLGEWLQARREAGRVDWREILARYVEAGRGLQAIHAAGLVHRDFKPQNAVVDADGCVKVLDFGLAVASGERVSADEPRLGTHRYAAPEQFLARDEGPHSDQFSFCVALYEALCGAPPFGDAVSTGARLATDRAAKPPRPPAELPGWLWAALERGLAARPEDRHPNMAALLHELTRDRRRGLRIAALVGGGATIGLLAAVLVAPRLAGDPRCELAASDRWDEQRPLLRLEGAELLRLDAAVTGWRARWQASRDELCAAVPRPDEATLGLRHSCLSYAHTTFVAVLTRAAAQPAGLGDALVQLPAPERCLDLTSSPRSAGAPASPELAAQIEGELAEVEAARLYGDRSHAQMHVDRARQLIAGCEDPRLVARVGLAHGIVARESGDRRRAADALDDALEPARQADPALAVEILHERARLDLLTYQHDRDGKRDLDAAARLLRSLAPGVA